MKNLFFSLFCIICFTSCDDGDIIVTSFDFEETSLETCGGPGGYVFFKINSQAAESFSVRLGTTDLLFFEDDTLVATLDGASNFANYRQYTEAVTSSYFCSEIPPTSPTVTVDYLGSSGIVTLMTDAIQNDNDGIDFVDSEDIMLEGYGDLDLDGIPNYYDFDDDGDNVPTAAELGPDPENPKDTDGDGIPDYLDPDDDGDGILTRNEDANQDLDPTNDITDGTVGPDYLNPEVAVETIVNAYRPHTYSLKSNISLFLSNLVLVNEEETIIQESLEMGEKQDVVNTNITVTPEFID